MWEAPLETHVSADGLLRPSSSGAFDPDLAPILGEFAWHSLTADSRLGEVSEEHYRAVADLLAETGLASKDLRVLEVAAYAHTTGYMLHSRLGAHCDLLDISPSTLKLGRRMACEQGLPTEDTRCVAADFHDLPYADAQFDLVYICSSLHHTWRWQRVVREMIRVLSPQGIMLLDNEPCRRSFCHYRFRANRTERYGDLERALDRLGILRTIAEPFPNTRPETLFGMVENQTIPIRALCGSLAQSCTPVAVSLNSDVCLGPLEWDLIARRSKGIAACTLWLTDEVARRVEEAHAEMSDADRGMGFGLPSQDEIERLCASTAEALVKLPADPDSPDYRVGLADIFGASVRIAVRKRGNRGEAPAARLVRVYPEANDIVLAFSPRIARLLDTRSALLPNIQSSSAEALTEVFPAPDWAIESEGGLRWLSPQTRQPRLLVPAIRSGSLLIVVRIYVAADTQPFRIELRNDGDQVAAFDAYRSDSLLLTPTVSCRQGTALRLSFSTRPLGSLRTGDNLPLFNLSYAGAFPL